MWLPQEITCDNVQQYTQIARSEQPEFIAERFPLYGYLSPRFPTPASLFPFARAERSPRSPPACIAAIRLVKNPHRAVFD